jgi:hypothetical protein
MSVEPKITILDLVTAEDKTLADLLSKKRNHALRAISFRDASSAINGDESHQAQNARKLFESRIAQEQAAEKEVESKISDSKTRKAALMEAAGIFSAPPVPAIKTIRPARKEATKPKDLRPSSELFLVREIIRKVGKPMLLDDILIHLGRPGDKPKRSSLRGTMMGYAKLGHIFTLESKSPHIFGLLEFKK